MITDANKDILSNILSLDEKLIPQYNKVSPGSRDPFGDFCAALEEVFPVATLAARPFLFLNPYQYQRFTVAGATSDTRFIDSATSSKEIRRRLNIKIYDGPAYDDWCKVVSSSRRLSRKCLELGFELGFLQNFPCVLTTTKIEDKNKKELSKFACVFDLSFLTTNKFKNHNDLDNIFSTGAHTTDSLSCKEAGAIVELLKSNIDKFEKDIDFDSFLQLNPSISYPGGSFPLRKHYVELKPQLQKELRDAFFKFFNYFLWTSLTYEKCDTVIQIQATTIPDITPFGVIAGFEVAEWASDWCQRIHALEVLVSHGLSFRVEEVAEERAKEVKRHATKSALAAIMARNMSHNIGSHVLSTLCALPVNNDGKNHNEALEDDKILFGYAQHRMDFIAQITTSVPSWTYPAWLLSNIMRGFYENKHLLNYIAVSENLKAKTYKGADLNNEKGLLEIKIQIKNDKKGVFKEILGSVDFMNDVCVAIPGGTVGIQAFYLILEAIIRNAAKHNLRASRTDDKPPDGLEITIDVEDYTEDDFVSVTVWDNNSVSDVRPQSEEVCEKYGTAHEPDCTLTQRINCKLLSPIIDKNGEVVRSNRGVAEIKMCAGYLAGTDLVQLCSTRDRVVLGTIRAVVAHPDELKKGSLGYLFKIPRPKEVLISGVPKLGISAEEYKAQLGKHSIHIDNNPIKFDYEFCLFGEDSKFVGGLKKLKNNKENDTCLQELSEQIEMYPGRLFIVDPPEGLKTAIEGTFLERRLAFLEKGMLPLNSAQGCVLAKFKKQLYDVWLKHFWASGLLPESVLAAGDISTPIVDLKGTDNYSAYSPDTLPPYYSHNNNVTGETTSVPLSNLPKHFLYLRHSPMLRKNNGYFECLSGAALHFPILAYPGTDDVRNKISQQLKENAIVDVIIADERIAAAPILLSDHTGAPFFQHLDAANIFLVKEFFGFEIKPTKFNFGRYDTRITIAEPNLISRRQRPDDTRTLRHDVLIVHQGILDKLKDKDNRPLSKVRIEELLQQLKKKIPFIFVTSGRGEPENLPKGVKYIAFSDVESAILAIPHSKFILTQMLMKATRDKRV